MANLRINSKIGGKQIASEEYVDTKVTEHENDITIHRKITISTSDPSGGNDGEIWMKYEQ